MAEGRGQDAPDRQASSAARLQTLLNAALASHQTGDLATARARYSELLAVAPSHPDALHLLGICLHQSGDSDGALTLIERAIVASGGSAYFLSSRGSVEQQCGRFAEAVESYGRSLARQPGQAAVHSNRGVALKKLGRFTEALSDFDRAIALAPDLAEAHSNRASVLQALGEAEAALQSADHAIAADAALAEAHNNRAIALLSLGRPEAALTSTDTAIGLRGDFADAYSTRAAALIGLGRLEEAFASCARAVELDPGLADAFARAGHALSGLDRLTEARSCFDRAIELQPGLVDALTGRAAVSLIENDPAAALADYDRALAAGAIQPADHAHRGLALKLLGRLDEAAESLDRAIDLDPEDADALSYRAFVQLERKAYDAAVADASAALTLRPDFADALTNRGAALQALGQADAALADLDRAIVLEAGHAEAHYRRGMTLLGLQRFAEALPAFERAVALNPGNAEALSNMSVALTELDRPEEALVALERAIEIDPTSAEAVCNLGAVLQDLGRFDEALQSYDRALALKPDHAPSWYNKGVALHQALRLPEALVHYDQATSLKPGYGEAFWNKSLALLTLGDFEAGWPLYEWRFRKATGRTVHRDYGCPRWDGTAPLDGRTILLHGEQGFGDAIQFVRYAALVAARGGRVVLEVARPLRGLLSRAAGVSEVIEAGGALPHIDFHCPLMSLPLAFGTMLASIPSAPTYLSADADRMAVWADRLGARRGKRIGLAWSGNAGHVNDRNRSLPLSALLKHLPDGPDYVALQKELRPGDAELLAADGRVRFAGDDLSDFDDTAALTRLMDAVISVDTSVVHLAGALGVPTLVLLPFCPDWRWLTERSDSPWYPSLKLSRQASAGDWAVPLADIGRMIEALG